MKGKSAITLLVLLLVFSLSSVASAYSPSTVRKQITAVQKEIENLEADIGEIQTSNEKKLAERKLRKYRRELSQLQWDLKQAIYREKVKSDRKLLSKHR